MAGFMDRARSKAGGGSGNFLDKEELVRSQAPFAISNVVWNPSGKFGPEWVLTVEPWYDDQAEPVGLLTFKSNPFRDSVFTDLQAQIEESDESLGPACVIRGKSQAGNRFFDIDEFDEETGRGKGSVPDEPEAPVAAAPTAGRPRPPRPGIAGAHASTGQRERAAEPAPTPRPTVVPPADIPANDEAPKRGRPRKSTGAPQGPADAVGAQAEAAQSIKSPVLAMGTVTCPHCEQSITNRLLPSEDGGLCILHPNCPTTKGTEILKYEEAV